MSKVVNLVAALIVVPCVALSAYVAYEMIGEPSKTARQADGRSGAGTVGFSSGRVAALGQSPTDGSRGPALIRVGPDVGGRALFSDNQGRAFVPMPDGATAVRAGAGAAPGVGLAVAERVISPGQRIAARRFEERYFSTTPRAAVVMADGRTVGEGKARPVRTASAETVMPLPQKRTPEVLRQRSRRLASQVDLPRRPTAEPATQVAQATVTPAPADRSQNGATTPATPAVQPTVSLAQAGIDQPAQGGSNGVGGLFKPLSSLFGQDAERSDADVDRDAPEPVKPGSPTLAANNDIAGEAVDQRTAVSLVPPSYQPVPPSNARVARDAFRFSRAARTMRPGLTVANAGRDEPAARRQVARAPGVTSTDAANSRQAVPRSWRYTISGATNADPLAERIRRPAGDASTNGVTRIQRLQTPVAPPVIVERRPASTQTAAINRTARPEADDADAAETRRQVRRTLPATRERSAPRARQATPRRAREQTRTRRATRRTARSQRASRRRSFRRRYVKRRRAYHRYRRAARAFNNER